jgi:STE24 endopeptidase
MNIFFALSLLLLVAGLVIRIWLGQRQIRHVLLYRGTVPAAFEKQVSLADHQRAADYTVARTRFMIVTGLCQAAIFIGWTAFGGLEHLNADLLEFLGEGLFQQVALLACFFLLGRGLMLPLSWWVTFRLDGKFGLNRRSLGLWVSDGLKVLVLLTVIGLPGLTALLWMMTEVGSTWWLWLWGITMAFIVLQLQVYPTVIAPLFNNFKPLHDPALQARVDALMRRCGFVFKGLFVMDSSRRSGHGNAYFTGLGPSKRVVFFDTLLSLLSPAEIDAVLAHELGHCRHGHIPKYVGVIFLLTGVLLAGLGLASSTPSFYTGLGVTPPLPLDSSPAVTLALLALVLPLLDSLVSPLLATYLRRNEFEADAFAGEHARAEDLASALLKLYRNNASTLTPDPVYVRFFHSHPTAAERLARLGFRSHDALGTG